MQTILIKPIHHRGKEVMALYFSPEASLNNAVKKIKDVRWSTTNSCWYLPCNRGCYTSLCSAAGNLCDIDIHLLREYLDQKRGFVTDANLPVHKATTTVIQQHPLNQQNLLALIAYRNLLTVKKYSQDTIRSYCNSFHHLLRLLGAFNVDDLNKERLQSYLLWLVEKKNSSTSYLNTTINAIKFYPVGLKKTEVYVLLCLHFIK